MPAKTSIMASSIVPTVTRTGALEEGSAKLGRTPSGGVPAGVVARGSAMNVDKL